MSQETTEQEYSEQMKFIVYKKQNKTRKELIDSELNLGYQGIPNSKITMMFFQAEKVLSEDEDGLKKIEKGNIQVYLDEKRNYIFAETTHISESVHKELFEGYEVLGTLEIPGKKEATEPFVKKMLMRIRAYKPTNQ